MYVVPPFDHLSFTTNRGPFPVGVVATIGVRVFINIDLVNRDKGRLADALDVFQEVTYFSSLVTNILGTGVISLKAWYGSSFCLGTTLLSSHRRYRRLIVADLRLVANKRTKAEKVLALLVESGMFYIFSDVRLTSMKRKKTANSSLIQAIMAAASLIRLPGSHIILESLYSQAAVHLAVSVASKFRTETDTMSGNLSADCRHTRQPRSIDGHDNL